MPLILSEHPKTDPSHSHLSDRAESEPRASATWLVLLTALAKAAAVRQLLRQ
jgi:hypothetical protein